MAWVTLDEARVLADFPTDLRPLYDAWLLANPSKAGRLAEITAGVVAEFRDAIASNPANRLDPDTGKIPESCLRSAEVLITGSLQNEMGLALSSDDAQAMTRAEILLRQVGYSHFAIGGGAQAEEPSPHVSSKFQQSERALP